MIGGVQGYVTKKSSGAPIIGAVVSCTSPKTNQQTTSASPDGYYSFPLDTPDTIHLQCDASGYTWSKPPIAFSDGQTKLVNIKMPI
jgi:hypothetical protein